MFLASAGCGGPASSYELTWTIDGVTQSASNTDDQGLRFIQDVGPSIFAETNGGEADFGFQASMPVGFGVGEFVTLTMRRPDDPDRFLPAPEQAQVRVTGMSFFTGRAPFKLSGVFESREGAEVEVSGTFEAEPRCWDPPFSSGRNAYLLCGYSLPAVPDVTTTLERQSAVNPCPDSVLDAAVGDASYERTADGFRIGGSDLTCQDQNIDGTAYRFCQSTVSATDGDCEYEVITFTSAENIVVTAKATTTCSGVEQCIQGYSTQP